MSRQQRAYCRKVLECTPLGFSSLKPFVLLGETGPCLCFCEQDAFQPGRRRFLGKLRTPLGMLVEFFGAHATLSPTEPVPVSDGVTRRSLIARSARRQFFARAIHTRGRYGSARGSSIRVGRPATPGRSWPTLAIPTAKAAVCLRRPCAPPGRCERVPGLPMWCPGDRTPRLDGCWCRVRCRFPRNRDGGFCLGERDRAQALDFVFARRHCDRRLFNVRWNRL